MVFTECIWFLHYRETKKTVSQTIVSEGLSTYQKPQSHHLQTISNLIAYRPGVLLYKRWNRDVFEVYDHSASLIPTHPCHMDGPLILCPIIHINSILALLHRSSLLFLIFSPFSGEVSVGNKHITILGLLACLSAIPKVWTTPQPNVCLIQAGVCHNVVDIEDGLPSIPSCFILQFLLLPHAGHVL